MKNFLLAFSLLGAVLTSSSQSKALLEDIAYEIQNYKTYEAACEYTYSIPFGDTLTLEAILTLEKVAADGFCGFHYNIELLGNNAADFTIYFDSTVYSSHSGKSKKISYQDSPSQFIRFKIKNGIVPAVYEKSTFYESTPYEVGKKIEDLLDDEDMIFSQKADTIIESEACLRFIIESKSSNPVFDKNNPEHWKEGKLIYDMCFRKSDHSPVLFKNEVYSSFINQLTIARYRNTILNQPLPDDYFSEENLLPEDWDIPEPDDAEKRPSPTDMVGQKSPEWTLPVLGSDEMYSSKQFEGKTVLLEFTATWCGHCWNAAKTMNKVEEMFGDHDQIEILSVYCSYLDSRESVTKFTEKMNTTSTVLYPGEEVGRLYKVYGYPCFFIISPEGTVSECIPGYGPEVEDKIIEALSGLGK